MVTNIPLWLKAFVFFIAFSCLVYEVKRALSKDNENKDNGNKDKELKK